MGELEPCLSGLRCLFAKEVRALNPSAGSNPAGSASHVILPIIMENPKVIDRESKTREEWLRRMRPILATAVSQMKRELAEISYEIGGMGGVFTELPNYEEYFEGEKEALLEKREKDKHRLPELISKKGKLMVDLTGAENELRKIDEELAKYNIQKSAAL